MVGLLALVFFSCNTTKYLAPDEELLVRQRVELGGGRAVDNRSDVAYELSTLTKQRPNGNFLFLFPREHFYFANSKPRDTTRIDRFLRTAIGQQPTFYSDSLSRRSAAAMADYLRYLGYFNATAYHEADRRRPGRVSLIYHVDPGRRYRIDSVSYRSADPGIDSLLQTSLPDALLRPGAPLDLNDFDREKTRLGRQLRNAGYAFFSNNYFDQLEIDTTERSGYANVYLNVLPPQREEAYRRYRIGQVTVVTDYAAVPSRRRARRAPRDTVLQGITLRTSRSRFRVRPEILVNSVFLRPGQRYSREAFEKTNIALGGLGIYRFVRINQQLDPARPDEIDYVIQLTPDNKMSAGVDLDLNYTNRRNGLPGTRNLIGLSVGPSFRNRNLLGGAELLTASLRAGVEVNPSFRNNRLSFFNTVDLGAEVELSLPRFRDFGPYRWLRGLGVLPPEFYTRLRERATTRYSVAYEYTLLRNFYSYTLADARFGYDLQRSATTSYRINHTAIDILSPRIEPLFDTIISRNPFLRLSFGDQYFLSALFRDVVYSRAGRPDRRGRSLGLNAQFEAAGTELYLANRLVNGLGGSTDTWQPGGGATYAQYSLGQVDVRYTKQYSPLSSLAGRFLFGLARPFGGAAAVPYVKQFFAGGANSMRAWQPRGLGPGGYVDESGLEQRNNLFLFQTGDLRLELNLEYRFNLFSLVRGAFFLDVGNVWTINYRGEERRGSQFRFTEKTFAGPEGGRFVHQPFYRQLAVAGGTGFRVDLSYFVFRLDAAVPLRYNYPQRRNGLDPLERNGLDYRESNYLRDFGTFGFREINWQLGLGYPF